MRVGSVSAKKSFYAYVLLLMLLNLSQAVGSGLLLFNNLQGICVVDVTTCIYYTLFTPLVYVAFLSDFFRWVTPKNEVSLTYRKFHHKLKRLAKDKSQNYRNMWYLPLQATEADKNKFYKVTIEFYIPWRDQRSSIFYFLTLWNFVLKNLQSYW